jgi:hypothetical protein
MSVTSGEVKGLSEVDVGSLSTCLGFLDAQRPVRVA